MPITISRDGTVSGGTLGSNNSSSRPSPTQVTDSEFYGGIAQNEANQSLDSGGVSYGTSGYYDSNTGQILSSDSSGLSGPQYTSSLGAADRQSIIQDAYSSLGLGVYASEESSAYWDQALASNNWTPEQFLETFNTAAAQGLDTSYMSAAEQLAMQDGFSTETIKIQSLDQINDPSWFKWLTEKVTNDPNSATAQAVSLPDYNSIITNPSYSITGTEGAEQLNIINSAGLDKDVAFMLDYTGYSDSLDADTITSFISNNPTISDKYDLTNSVGFQSLAMEAAAAQEAGSAYYGIFGQQPDLAYQEFTFLDENGEKYTDSKIVAADDVSLTNLIGNAFTFLGNRITGGAFANVVGDVVSSLGFGNLTAATSAAITQQGLEILQPFKQRTFVDSTGRQYVVTSVFGEETAVPVNQLVNNSVELNSMADEAFSSGVSSVRDSVAMGLGETSTGNPKKDDWRSIYDPNDALDPNAILTGMITKGVNGLVEELGEFAPEYYRAEQLRSKITSGDNVVAAAVSVYGNDIAQILPTGWEDPTELALRIGTGTSTIDAINEVYGEELDLDNPLGQAGVTALSTFDKTGDGNAAIREGFLKYLKEGGEFADIDLAIPESLRDLFPDFDMEGFDLGISWEELKGWLPDLKLSDFALKFGFDGLKKIDFSGIDLSMLGDGLDWIKDKAPWILENFPDIDVELDVEVPEVDIDVPEVEVPEVEVAVPEVDIDLPEFSLKRSGSDSTGSGVPEKGKYIDPFGDSTKEQLTEEDLPLSQVLLKSTPTV